MKNRKVVLGVVIVVAVLLIALVGATFAYFSAVITENDKTQTKLRAADLEVEFDGTQEIEAMNIEPGWSGQKIFTVENLNDYDMAFDINFTGVVNTFNRTSDLTASASAIFVDNDHLSDTVQMLGLNETNISSGTKYSFAFPNNNMYVLPTDNTGSVNTNTNPVTFTPGTGVFKVAKVFIPANSEQQFTITLSYAYLAPARGYTLGSSTDPNNQSVDKGKYFRTTINIVANAIDSGALQNNS